MIRHAEMVSSEENLLVSLHSREFSNSVIQIKFGLKRDHNCFVTTRSQINYYLYGKNIIFETLTIVNVNWWHQWIISENLNNIL